MSTKKSAADRIPVRQYMGVSYEERAQFKHLCIRENVRYGWDTSIKCWYVESPSETAMQALAKWTVKGGPAQTVPESASHDAIVAEFSDELKRAGLVLDGEPVMDGKLHRVPVEGARRGARDGAYVGHLDGVANGWYQNYRQGCVGKWKSHLGARVTLTPEKQAAIAQRKLERSNKRDQALKEALATLPGTLAGYQRTDIDSHAYVLKKQVSIYPDTDSDLRINTMGSLVIPLYNVEGNLQSAQWISPDGTKGIYKDTVKTAACAVVWGYNDLRCRNQGDESSSTSQYFRRRAAPNFVVLCEGWATSKSVSRCASIPVVFSVSAENLIAVAKAVRQKWFSTKILICADRDTEKSGETGQIYGQKAAEAVNGRVIFPSFPPGIRGTDFNDLYIGLMCGRVRQVIAADKLIRDRVHNTITEMRIQGLAHENQCLPNQKKTIDFGI